MPIRIPADIPAAQTLQDEHIFFMEAERAYHQDIRPLQILIVNLMPNKAQTETQLMRLLGNTPLQVDIHLTYTATYTPRHTSEQYLSRFYQPFEAVRQQTFDGCIITGAPVELMAFEDVHYWAELREILDWTTTHVTSTLHICWGAQAGLYHHYGIGKQRLPAKISGVYAHRVIWPRPIKLFRGFDDVFTIPHSRHTQIDAEAARRHPDLRLLVDSDEVGLTCLGDRWGKQFFMLGHLEYETYTLREEYLRDQARGLSPAVPAHYFKNDDPEAPVTSSWRSGAHLLFANWLNYYVYQMTPFELDAIPNRPPSESPD